MNETSKKTLVIGLFLAVLLLCGGSYYKLMIQAGTLNEISNSIKEKQDEIDELTEESTDLDKLRDREPEIRANLELLTVKGKRLPAEDKVDQIIQNIKTMLTVSSVIFSSFDPLDRESRNFYVEVPLSISCTAPFHNFGQFLNMIEVSPTRLMRVKEFTIAIHNENDIKQMKVNPFMHEIDLTLAAYVTKTTRPE
ncbi:type 4a pilus biogenesis protein PilO [Candidatus Sumerlaeota bacterium]